jgi:hypothetical protein
MAILHEVNVDVQSAGVVDAREVRLDGLRRIRIDGGRATTTQQEQPSEHKSS